MIGKGKKATILTFVAAGGVVVTVVLTGKLAPVAKAKKEAALAEKRARLNDPEAELTKWESMRAQLGTYTPVILSLLATTGSIFGSDILNKKNYSELKLYGEQFRKMSDQLAGEGHSKLVEQAMEKQEQDKKNGKPEWGEKQKFILEILPVDIRGGDSLKREILFESTMAEVIQSEYEVNRYFVGNGEISMLDFLDCFELKAEAMDVVDEKIGYDSYTGEAFYGYLWIDFVHEETTLPDGSPAIRIRMPFAPHPMYEAAEDNN